MAVPKRKKSKSRVRMRKANIKATIPSVVACPDCGADKQTHCVCPACGRYRGRQLVSVEA